MKQISIKGKNFILLLLVLILSVGGMYPAQIPSVESVQDFLPGGISDGTAITHAEAMPAVAGYRNDSLRVSVIRLCFSRRVGTRGFSNQVLPVLFILIDTSLCIFLMRRICIAFLEFYHFPNFIITYIQLQDGQKG